GAGSGPGAAGFVPSDAGAGGGARAGRSVSGRPSGPVLRGCTVVADDGSAAAPAPPNGGRVASSTSTTTTAIATMTATPRAFRAKRAIASTRPHAGKGPWCAAWPRAASRAATQSPSGAVGGAVGACSGAGGAAAGVRLAPCGVTRQTVLERSSQTISAPRGSTATPTGRPRVRPSSPRKPVTTSTGSPAGRPLRKGTNTTL